MTSQQPREFITYLGYTISYLVVAISFIVFSFSFTNVLFPEIGGYSSLGYQSVFGSLGVFKIVAYQNPPQIEFFIFAFPSTPPQEGSCEKVFLL
jgi:hypothetical protein